MYINTRDILALFEHFRPLCGTTRLLDRCPSCRIAKKAYFAWFEEIRSCSCAIEHSWFSKSNLPRNNQQFKTIRLNFSFRIWNRHLQVYFNSCHFWIIIIVIEARLYLFMYLYIYNAGNILLEIDWYVMRKTESSNLTEEYVRAWQKLIKIWNRNCRLFFLSPLHRTE